MIYITGDTHMPLDMAKLSLDRFPEQAGLTKDDYVIVCGDFGGVWDGRWHDHKCMKDLEARNFTTLFIDGNHENFHLLNRMPMEVWNGGKVHRVGKGVLHLMRGQVFALEGMTFFTMGGGYSIDRAYRTPGRSWWPEEMPSDAERREAMANLARHGYSVDVILTHAAPESLMNLFFPDHAGELPLNLFLQEVMDRTAYRRWFFGHLHEDRTIDDRHRALYQDVIPLTLENESGAITESPPATRRPP